jgi:uncharacterized SAM-dependent methyltransferase
MSTLVAIMALESASRPRHADFNRFILNGLHHANKLLGEKAFNVDDWRVIGEYVYDTDGGHHQAFYSPLHDTFVQGELIEPHERIRVEQSFKFSKADANRLWKAAGMTEVDQWKHNDEYGEPIAPASPVILMPLSNPNPGLT